MSKVAWLRDMRERRWEEGQRAHTPNQGDTVATKKNTAKKAAKTEGSDKLVKVRMSKRLTVRTAMMVLNASSIALGGGASIEDVVRSIRATKGTAKPAAAKATKKPAKKPAKKPSGSAKKAASVETKGSAAPVPPSGLD